MRVPDDRLEELRRIYKEAAQEEITLAEAAEIAQRLLFLYQTIGRPLPRDLRSPGQGLK